MTIKVFHKTERLEAVLFTGDNVAEVQELTGKQRFALLDEEDRPLADNPEAMAEVWADEHGCAVEVCMNEWVVKTTEGHFGATPHAALADNGWQLLPPSQDKPPCPHCGGLFSSVVHECCVQLVEFRRGVQA